MTSNTSKTAQMQDFGYQATKDARGRRIRTGEEVLLSPESVEDLRGARPAYASTRTPIDKVLFHPTPTAGIVGRFDSFSALTDTTEGPLPKSILLEYFINQLAPWLGSYDDAQNTRSPSILLATICFASSPATQRHFVKCSSSSRPQTTNG
ncbi:hypothetical protein DID88_010428 [Monilinia fructigena]|uniref:Uncharacterized protein n=1 Tax=Monilinia fructigena TaxID=38457 RepID=A0A395ILD7_9HELO|nr:hypothetical protein DID88_010428 [Monilinia fructigena]